MSDTAVAVLILPALIALTIALECTRVGCNKIARKLRATQSRSPELEAQDLRW